MDPALIQRIVEAALLASSQPLTLAQLQALFGVDEPLPNGAIETALQTLAEGCAGRGVELVEVASGFRYQVRTDVHQWVSRLWAERPQRYTRATLETLALIAYRQPITRGEIEQIRGVAVSSNIIKMLEEREWIRVIGHRDVPGKPALFGTTRLFLDYFNLKSLDELPPLSELRDLTDLEPQLPLDTELPPQATAPISLGIDEDEGEAETSPSSPEDAADGPGSKDIAAPDQATSGESASDQPTLPAPSLEDATDVAFAPDITATATVETLGDTVEFTHDASQTTDLNPLDADDDAAPEHTA